VIEYNTSASPHKRKLSHEQVIDMALLSKIPLFLRTVDKISRKLPVSEDSMACIDLQCCNFKKKFEELFCLIMIVKMKVFLQESSVHAHLDMQVAQEVEIMHSIKPEGGTDRCCQRIDRYPMHTSNV